MNWHFILFASLAFCMESSSSNFHTASQPVYIYQPDGTLIIEAIGAAPIEIPTGFQVSKLIFNWCRLDGEACTEKFIRRICALPTLRAVQVEAVQGDAKIIKVLAETCAANLGITALHLRFYSKDVAETILQAFAQMPPRLTVLEVDGWQNFGQECEVSFSGKENVLWRLQELSYTEQEKSPFARMQDIWLLMPELKKLKVSVFAEDEFSTAGRMHALAACAETIEFLSIVLLDSTARSDSEITDAISKVANLKQLTLVAAKDQISFEALFAALKGKALEKLDISGSIIDAGSVLDSCASLFTCKTLHIGYLKELPMHLNATIEHIELEDVCCEEASVFLNKLFALLPSLKTYSLSFTGFDAESFVESLSSLTTNAHLQNLSIKTEVAETFLSKLQNQAYQGTLKGVEAFTLWIPNHLPNTKELVRILPKMPALRQLTIEISTESVADEIALLLTGVGSEIEEINIGGEEMGMSIANAVAECLHKWPKLKSVNADLLRATSEIPFEQRAACKIFHN